MFIQLKKDNYSAKIFETATKSLILILNNMLNIDGMSNS